MLFARITISNPAWIWPAVAICALAVLALWWSYRSAPGSAAHRVAAVLKFLGIAAIAACLLEPLWTGQKVKPGSNAFAIVADNSQGLQVKDEGETADRGELLRQLLNAPADWQSALEENFELRRFYFDARLRATRDFRELNFQGKASAIGGALKSVKERFAGRPLAGILLLTDGNATDLKSALPGGEAGLPPVYPVVLGKPGAVKDVAVAQVNVTQTAFEDAPVSLQADVTASGFSGETVVAQLFDQAGKLVQEKSARARSSQETLAFRFQWRPEKSGLSFYRLVTRIAGQSAKEATQLNNHRIVSVDRGAGPYRILYVGGRPNWEYKFLNRAVQEDDQVQLVALIRVANREPKFEFRGRAGETGNPLFRGFGDQSREEVERYDQPVLTRLNTRDELELRGGFPRLPEDLYGYHAIILDDVEAEFFAADQAMLLQKYVSERGGGFLMLGGVECFQQGKYQNTPIGNMLPVYLEKVEAAALRSPFKLSLGREGWLQPWARLRDNENDEKTRLQEMVPFQVLNPVKSIKPGASVVAAVTDAGGREFPALVTQRFGRGRSAALAIGDFWRWGMRDAEARRDLEKAWRQMMRWLVNDVPQQVELAVEPVEGEGSESVKLQVRVRDLKFQPLDDANVTIEVGSVMAEAGANTNVIRLRSEPASSEAGLYEAVFVARGTGGFKATATVTNSAGARAGQAVAGWSTDLAAEEFRSLQPNTAWLEALARQTGGEVISASRLAEFARSLPRKQAPVMETWTFPAWHTPVLFAFALACLVLEWGLRRWKGLP